MLFRCKVQCDTQIAEAGVWEAARRLEREQLSVHAIDPLNRQFGICLTTDGYSDAPFHDLVSELRGKALRIVSAEKRHQCEYTWHEMELTD